MNKGRLYEYNVAVHVWVNSETFSSQITLNKIDRVAKVATKRSIADISRIDFVEVTFISGYGFGTFSYTQSRQMPRNSPRFIEDSIDREE
jgi:hypothetical protein